MAEPKSTPADQRVDASAVLDAPVAIDEIALTTLRAQLGDATTVVVFLRHFGCLFCRERAAQMCRREDELRAAGAKLVFVGSGTPAMAAAFARERAGSHPVLSDTSRRTIAAAGMRGSAGATVHWRLLANVLRALRGGFRQTRVLGDAWQQGGVLVFDRGGAVLHAQIDRVGGDPLDVDAILSAIRR
jgi:peroxiredoxin